MSRRDDRFDICQAIASDLNRILAIVNQAFTVERFFLA